MRNLPYPAQQVSDADLARWFDVAGIFAVPRVVEDANQIDTLACFSIALDSCDTGLTSGSE